MQARTRPANASDTSSSTMPNENRLNAIRMELREEAFHDSDERIIDATMTRITGFFFARLLRKMARGEKKSEDDVIPRKSAQSDCEKRTSRYGISSVEFPYTYHQILRPIKSPDNMQKPITQPPHVWN